MNRTAIFVTFAVLAGFGIIGAIVLLIHRPDASATFTAFVIQILGMVTLAAGTFYGLTKTNEKLDTVQKQTNGQLHAKEQRIAELEAKLEEERKRN